MDGESEVDGLVIGLDRRRKGVSGGGVFQHRPGPSFASHRGHWAVTIVAAENIGSRTKPDKNPTSGSGIGILGVEIVDQVGIGGAGRDDGGRSGR